MTDKDIIDSLNRIIIENERYKKADGAFKNRDEIKDLILFSYEIDECDMVIKGFMLANDKDEVIQLIKKEFFIASEENKDVMKIEEIMKAEYIYDLLIKKKVDYLRDF